MEDNIGFRAENQGCYANATVQAILSLNCSELFSSLTLKNMINDKLYYFFKQMQKGKESVHSLLDFRSNIISGKLLKQHFYSSSNRLEISYLKFHRFSNSEVSQKKLKLTPWWWS